MNSTGSIINSINRFLKEPIIRILIYIIFLVIAASAITISLKAVVAGRIVKPAARKIANQQNKGKIAGIINNRLDQVNIAFREMVLASNHRHVEILYKHAMDNIREAESAVLILNNSGTFIESRRVNINDKDIISEKIIFIKPEHETISIECINILPKLTETRQLVLELEKIIHKKIGSDKDRHDFSDIGLILLIKKIEALLLRTKESANKIFYDIKLETGNLETRTSKLKKTVEKFRVLLKLFFDLIVIIGILLASIKIYRILMLEKQTDAQNKKLLQVIEQSPSTIVITDTDGLVEYVNPFFEQCTGYSRDEIVGKSTNLLKSGKTPAKIYTDLWETITSKKAWSGELCNKKKNGEFFYEKAVIAPVIDAAGEIINYSAVKLDVTDKVQIMESLKEEKENAKELARQAQAANIAKSYFLANMSHELRTPMNGILGVTDVLLDTGLDENQSQFAEIIKNSGETLLSIINDILDFSKIEDGKLDIKEKKFDLRKIIDDFACKMEPSAREKGLEFICTIQNEIPRFFKGDFLRLTQVLTHLTGNAVKFTEKGMVKVSCTLEQDLPDSCRICFFVEDTGPGIPMDRQEELFDKFTQADVSATRKFGGTGIGLAMSKQLAELMGGKIGVKSKEGKGSIFRLAIELKKSDLI